MPGGTGKKTHGSGGWLTGPEPFSLWHLPNGLVIQGEIYPICTDFRAAVAYEMAAMRGTLTEEAFFGLWFPERRPEDLDAAAEAVGKFYNLGREGTGEAGPVPYSFFQDDQAIFCAFRREYGLDLGTARLHWWQFRALLEGLFTHSFQQRVEFRTADLTGRSAQERSEILKFRRMYEIQREDLDEHLRQLERISQKN